MNTDEIKVKNKGCSRSSKVRNVENHDDVLVTGDGVGNLGMRFNDYPCCSKVGRYVDELVDDDTTTKRTVSINYKRKVTQFSLSKYF